MLVLLQFVLFCGTFSPFVEPLVRLHLQNVWLVVAVSESDSAQIMNTSCKLAPACMTEPCMVFTMTPYMAIIWQSLSGMLCLLAHCKSPNQLITFIGRASWFWHVTIVQLFPSCLSDPIFNQNDLGPSLSHETFNTTQRFTRCITHFWQRTRPSCLCCYVFMQTPSSQASTI